MLTTSQLAGLWGRPSIPAVPLGQCRATLHKLGGSCLVEEKCQGRADTVGGSRPETDALRRVHVDINLNAVTGGAKL